MAYVERMRVAKIAAFERQVDRYMHGRVAKNQPKAPEFEEDDGVDDIEE